ncbi:uncharacterized protein LOC106072363 [Biomphalaria glabrata]|uniref:Uncharacterized protein LOC106072363 n=1 Tax=Biomphalaria glabrata TaxID=6526 RepID=A0A9W2YXB2_BIOGL|nr:uncharacterized protein LOC106072363 [Biomphalaria glabrata]
MLFIFLKIVFLKFTFILSVYSFCLNLLVKKSNSFSFKVLFSEVSSQRQSYLEVKKIKQQGSEESSPELLTIIKECSRFPFAFACPDMTSSTVVKCLNELFALFGLPAYVHIDRGTSFMSTEVQYFLHERGIATSRTTPYSLRGHGQIDKLNGTLWKAITLAQRSKELDIAKSELVLNDAYQSILSLLCTAINRTPHERLLGFNQRSGCGTSLPTWLTSPGPVLLKKNVRSSKYDPITEEVDLVTCNPQYTKRPRGNCLITNVSP